MRRMLTAGLCVFAVVTVAAAGAAVDGYAISGDSAIETPTQTVSYEGQEYTIDGVSRITAGENITVTTSVPSGSAYYINLRGPDNQLISRERKTNSTEHTFSYFGPNNEAGTYVATIKDNANTVAVHPIVIAGYDVSVLSPDDVEAGEEATISATVTERQGPKHSSLDRVEVVVGNDDVEAQKSMAKIDDDTYEATVSTDGLAAETYNVYVVVRGNKTVRQRAEILGVSDTVGLTVTETGMPTPEQTSDGNGDSSGDGDPSVGTTTPDERTPTSVETTTHAGEIETGSSQSGMPDTETEGGSNGAPATSGEPSTSSAAKKVIAPATQSETTTTGGSGPGFTIGIALLAVLATLAIGQRR